MDGYLAEISSLGPARRGRHDAASGPRTLALRQREPTFLNRNLMQKRQLKHAGVRIPAYDDGARTGKGKAGAPMDDGGSVFRKAR